MCACRATVQTHTQSCARTLQMRHTSMSKSSKPTVTNTRVGRHTNRIHALSVAEQTMQSSQHNANDIKTPRQIQVILRNLCVYCMLSSDRNCCDTKKKKKLWQNGKKPNDASITRRMSENDEEITRHNYGDYRAYYMVCARARHTPQAVPLI